MPSLCEEFCVLDSSPGMWLCTEARVLCACVCTCVDVCIYWNMCVRVCLYICVLVHECVCLHVLMSFDNLYESARAHVGIPAHVSPHDRIARRRQEGRMALE